MVVHSIANNSYVPLASGASFEGGIEVTTAGVSICVSTFCSSEVKVIIKQYRQNAASTLMHSNEENVAADTKGLVQTPVKAGFFSIKVENLGSNMTFTNITTVLQATHYLNLDIRSLTAERDSVTIAGGSIDISGVQDVVVTGRSGTGFLSYLNDNIAIATMPSITGSVSVISQPHLSYLTDNVAIATMPPITGSVSVTSQPHLSYLTDNIAVATQPALAFATDKVDATGSSISVSNFPATQPISGSVSVSNLPATQPVSGSVSVSNFPATQPISGTIAVSSQPALSYLTDNIAVATMPPITGSVSVTSQPHLSYLTDNIAVATQPALAFSTDKVDATGSAVTISSAPFLSKATSSIDISGQNVVTSHTTSSVTSWENSTFLISFDSGNSVRQIKGSTGSLHSLSITNDNNAIAFVALYNLPAAGVTPGVTTPEAVFAINKNQQIQLPLHAVQFSNAISFFTATTYNGGTPLTLVYLTASYNG